MRRSLPTRRLALLCACLVCCTGMLLAAAAFAQTPPTTPPATAPSPAQPTPAPPPPAPATQPPPAKAAPPAATTPAQPAPELAPAPPVPPKAPPPAPKASGPSLEDLLKPVNTLSNAIDAAEKSLEQTPGSQRDLAALRTGIDKIENNAKDAPERLRPRLEEVRSQIAKLGAPPAANEPPEEPDVTAERQRLNGIAAQIDGAIKKAALIEVRARQLISRVQHARQGIFTRFLFSQTDTPLQWRVWQEAGDQLYLARRQTGFILSNWWSVATLNGIGLLSLLGAVLLSYFGLRLLTRRLIHAHLDESGPSIPTLPERAANAAWVAAALALPAAIALLVLYVGLDELGLLYWQVERFAESALFPLYVMIGITALARALLQPGRPRWRVFHLADAGARTVCFAVQAIVVVYALEYLARRLASILSLPPSASIVTTFIASLLYAVLLLLIVRTPLTPPSAAPGVPVSRWRPHWLKGLLLALAMVLVGASMLGYVTLGRFIVTQLLTTGTGILIVALLHVAIRAIVPEPAEQPAGMSRIIEQRLRLDDFGRGQLARGLRGLLNVLLFALAVPLLLLAWGMTGPEIMSWVRAAVFGFDVGGVRVSLSRILVALALFVGLLAATRFVQRWLAAGALAQGRMDPGLANSIYTGAGYIGFAVAALAAIAYAGFDITSLAIVAGALSVGIGFGLQSIVNNFVSGLILLVERPIKVGDWISIKEGEGYVRRIAVRSTEIETFGRASLIVPNSELITQTVVNLTHRNLLGRLKVKVRVSYQADPEHALRVLQQVAEGNTSILRHPPPVVVLDNLGDQALEFSVRVYLADINRSLQVQTELRTAILRALREEGIDVPYAPSLAGHAHGPAPSARRATVTIGVGHDCDPDAVLAALKEAARRSGSGTDGEGAQVAFAGIDANALEFSVSVALADGANAAEAETALRTQAIKMLRERGIDLASPQSQVRLRDLEGLRAFIARMAQERAHRNSAPADDAVEATPRKTNGD
jgi:potassium efflux system protein